MRKQLKKDLAQITESLNIPTYYLHKTDTKTITNTYVEYEIINEYPSDFCGDRTFATSYLVQIDVFSKYESAFQLMDDIKENLEQKGYKFTSSYDAYEDNTKLYHFAMRFNYKKIN